MNEIDTMATYEAKTAKKVYLYKNGFKHGQPKCMVVNDRQIRDFSTFLSRVTSGIRAPVAVRNIYTPSEGHRVNKLDDLRSGQYYVAGGSEQFKKVKYGGELLKSPPKRQRNFFLPNRSQEILITTSRYKIPVEKPFVIHMFRNGDEKYRGARILLPRKIMGSWEHVLELITQKTNLITPAKRICTLDGRTIHAVSEIQDGGKYVALEGSKSFQRVSYCATDEKKLPLVRSIPRAAVRLRHKSEYLTRSEGEERLSDPPIPFISKRGRGTLKRRKSIRPMAGRKNKEGREKAIKDHREDSIFGGSPPLERDQDESIRVTKMPSPPPKSSLATFQVAADSDKEGHADHLESSLEEPPLRESLQTLTQIQEVNESTSEPARPVLEEDSADAGITDTEPLRHSTDPSSKSETGNTEYVEKPQDAVFQANGQHHETLDAETVPEEGEIEVEKPIDQQEPEEVEEEGGGTEAGVHQIRTPVQQAKDVHLEPQTAQISVDLSLQRASPKTTTKPEPNSRGPSKPPSRGPSKPPSRGPSKPPSRGPSKPSSRGPSKPPSRHSVASQGSAKPKDNSKEEEVAAEAARADESGEVLEQMEEEVIPEEVEEVREKEDTERDTAQVVTSDSTPPTPPFSSPQEPDVQEELEDQT